jgi:LacI family transcriptional regulator
MIADMGITQQEIAERLGISQETVSRVLHRSHRARVSDETRREIETLARELGYRPRNRTTHTIAFVLRGETLADEATALWLREVGQALQERGYRLAVTVVNNDRVEHLRETLTPKAVDGALFFESFGGRVRELVSTGVPFVVVSDEENINTDVDVVTVDTVGTLERLTRYLLECGHERLCLASVAPDISVYRHMEQGIRRELVRAGLSPEKLRVLHLDCGPNGDVPRGEMGRAFLEGFAALPQPTAVIAADLWRAVPVAYALRDAGYRIPQEVSFVSVFDNHHLWELMPPVTATTAYDHTVARRAVERLLEKIEAPDSPPRHERIIGELIERDSVGPAEI